MVVRWDLRIRAKARGASSLTVIAEVGGRRAALRHEYGAADPAAIVGALAATSTTHLRLRLSLAADVTQRGSDLALIADRREDALPSLCLATSAGFRARALVGAESEVRGARCERGMRESASRSVDMSSSSRSPWPCVDDSSRMQTELGLDEGRRGCGVVEIGVDSKQHHHRDVASRQLT